MTEELIQLLKELRSLREEFEKSYPNIVFTLHDNGENEE